jgi:hypothetical protein
VRDSDLAQNAGCAYLSVSVRCAYARVYMQFCVCVCDLAQDVVFNDGHQAHEQGQDERRLRDRRHAVEVRGGKRLPSCYHVEISHYW